ncbi:hypothetical protein PQ455_16470 [Sphingomonas naphthae]|uniref:Uncharacterized protein n=1 Tax=Sphingomonas naphthae TaxID=1813468 RepID=A0ABY7TMW4_9SPHN|nr:hypothetical protein [Sphingomonas naphthae]WCT73194.1 hypothetical protein PQ455_16470 [Sphingomonas naphthae]
MSNVQSLRPLVAVAALGLLAACNPAPQDAVPANSADAPTGTVTREEVTPAPAPAPAIAQAAIQTQPGPDGSTVTLNKVAVTGDVMTVQLTYQGASGLHTQYMKLDEVSLVDDATAQRISVLKDNGGKWLAAPLATGGDGLTIRITDTPTIVWFKFPAPPATSKTVSLNLPEAAPFDGVPVTR